MAWCRDPANPDPYAAQTAPDGVLTELSVSGAGFVATTHPYLDVGQTVLIACLGATGAVVVRHIDRDRYPGESYYGVEFGDPTGRLTTVLHETFLMRDGQAPTLYLPQG